MRIRFFGAILFAASISFASFAAAGPLPPDLEKLGQKGLAEIYEMNFSGAESDFRQFLDQSGGHPLGYFGLAAAAWTDLVYGSQVGDSALEADFWKRADTAVRKTNEWIKKNPKDAAAFLALGGDYGLKSRLLVSEKQWFSAAINGRRALKAMRQAQKLDPELYDAYLGIGTWEYYADVLPRFIKALNRVLLGGDHEQGIKDLRLAAEKARYVGITANLILIEIFLTDKFGARNPPEALRIIRALRQQYPASPLFLQIEQTSLFVSQDYAGLAKATQEYERRIQMKRPYYAEDHTPHVCLPLGTMHMAQGDLKAAKEEFLKCLPYIGEKDRPNQWALWSLVRLGQVEDELGDRKSAQEHYRQVVPYKDFWGYKVVAEDYLKHPFKPEDGAKLRLTPP